MRLETTKVESCIGIRANDGTHVGNFWESFDCIKLFVLPNYETQLVITGESRLEIRFVERLVIPTQDKEALEQK